MIGFTPSLTKEARKIPEETLLDAYFLSHVVLIGRLNGLWPRLVNLHAWITKN